MEEIVILLLVLLTMLIVLCLYAFLNKRGLYFALVLLNIIGLVLSFKITYAFRMNINLGIIPFLASLMVIYFFINNFGHNETKNLIKISIYANVATAILLIIMNYYVPATTETISINMQGTFAYNYKILIAYPIIASLSQLIVIKLYKLVSQIQDNIIISMILTYIITAAFYTIILYLLSYIKVLPVKYSIFLGISTYIIGLAITVIHTIFVKAILMNRKVVK